jgi:hypothetical protein
MLLVIFPGGFLGSIKEDHARRWEKNDCCLLSAQPPAFVIQNEVFTVNRSAKEIVEIKSWFRGARGKRGIRAAR